MASSKVKVDQKMPEIYGMTTDSSVLGNGAHGFGDLFAVSNGFSSKSGETDIGVDFMPSTSEPNYARNGLNSQSVVKASDPDENFGEFRAAISKTGLKHDEEPKVNGLSHFVVGKSQVDNNSVGSIDLFAVPNGFSSESGVMGIGIDSKESTVVQTDLHDENEQIGSENELHFLPFVKNRRLGESTAPIPEKGSKEHHDDPRELLPVPSTTNGQGNETRSETPKRALPLSIFGDEEQVTDETLNVQDDFMHQPVSHPRNVQRQGSTISINDLISNLYSQAEQIPSVGTMEKQTVNELSSTERMFDSNSVDGGDDFGDGSWEFKDASSQTRAENQTFFLSLGDAHQNISPKLKLNNYVDFYCKLKDELCFVARCHLDGLKVDKINKIFSHVIIII
ncbi:unnamed protein product [Ilex paraguariensis]|uniref:Uncharacterized protein n=1 Tax=Ilex paraguariensis TaxID=185542 RepID=A0ABC8SSD8_9AQUA